MELARRLMAPLFSSRPASCVGMEAPEAGLIDECVRHWSSDRYFDLGRATTSLGSWSLGGLELQRIRIGTGAGLFASIISAFSTSLVARWLLYVLSDCSFERHSSVHVPVTPARSSDGFLFLAAARRGTFQRFASRGSPVRSRPRQLRFGAQPFWQCNVDGTRCTMGCTEESPCSPKHGLLGPCLGPYWP